MDTRAKHPLETQLLNFAANPKKYVYLDDFSSILEQIKYMEESFILKKCQSIVLETPLKVTNPPNIDAIDKTGNNALQYVSFNGAFLLLKQLIDAKADPNLPTVKSNDTPVTLATLKGHEACLTLLISSKANINHRNQNGYSALDYAIKHNHTSLAKKLIEAGAYLDEINGDGSSLLTEAIMAGNIDIVLMLLENNVQIDNPIMLYYFLKKQNSSDPIINDYLHFLKKQNRLHLLKSNSTDQQPNYVIIPLILDISKTFKALSAQAKIDLVALRIKEICALLAKVRPGLPWIIGWREFGIEDEKTNSISDESKKYLKKLMFEITTHYPTLIVIAGSSLVRKSKKVTDLPKILQYYNDLIYFENIENSYENKHQHQLSFHRKCIDSLMKQLKPTDSVEVTSNKIRIYHNQLVLRHGKITPYYENHQLSVPVVYQPAKGKNLCPIVKINHDLFGFSICREIGTGFEIIKQYKTIIKNGKNLLVQFLISHSIDVEIQSIQAKWGIIHLDNRFDPTMVLARKYQTLNLNIEIFPYDVMQKIESLDIRALSVYPLQFQILNRINEEYNKQSDMTYKTALFDLKKATRKYLLHYRILQQNYDDFYHFLKSKKSILGDHFVNQIWSIFQANSSQLCFSLRKSKPQSMLTLSLFKQREKQILNHLDNFNAWWTSLCTKKEYSFLIERLKKCIDPTMIDRSGSLAVLNNQIHQIQLELRRIPYSQAFLSKSTSEKQRISDILIALRKWSDAMIEVDTITSQKSMKII